MASTQYPPTLTLCATAGPADAAVILPGSKSITNRALLLAALADGKTYLEGPLHSDDTRYMAEALTSLGVHVETLDNGDMTVAGCSGTFSAAAEPLFIGNSGTTIRFLTAAVCLAPASTTVRLDGVARMRQRPIRDLLDALNDLGVRATSINGDGCPPVEVPGGGMNGGSCNLRGDISSQFLSAALQVAPYAAKDVVIHIAGDLISKPYVDITQSVMKSFGVEFTNDGYQTLFVKAGQRYQPQHYAIEADASNASYFMAAAAATGGVVTIRNLSADSIQGDVAFARVLEQMGCDVTMGEQITVRGPQALSAIDVDMTAIPDTAQTLAVLCAMADGTSHVTGLGSLRVKETDRIAAIATELRKLGVAVEETTDSWTITPPIGALQAAAIDTYDDHRMAMSFAVAGLRIDGLVINDPGCVAKTFPDFWDRWEAAFPGSVR